MRKGASKFGMTVILNSLNRMHIYIYDGNVQSKKQNQLVCCTICCQGGNNAVISVQS